MDQERRTEGFRTVRIANYPPGRRTKLDHFHTYLWAYVPLILGVWMVVCYALWLRGII